MLQDPIADFLNRIKNAYAVKKDSVVVSHSKVAIAILSVMKEQGSIQGFTVNESGTFPVIDVELSYVDGAASMRSCKRVSKPSLRVYRGYSDMPIIRNGLGYLIVSTSSGIMTSKQAINAKLGGELICEIDYR
ncbi:30S ribosomal protein S8 [Candidatus Comchoanobacter bicostacola]|uniref:Small ribosomal subunit protein uS8 n=1 Tax=Candidatus Comchoanobacter bicostacola TaxID=2919598 RepID=A0ABY5DIU6_9GAMM|nr:30S ribosomal protein S8 [Candidatus Comchoanobacter bicostacola]UTC24284.1 30S ribosomal protein S8 [Candidatus Comchoanobacter bicostacola]